MFESRNVPGVGIVSTESPVDLGKPVNQNKGNPDSKHAADKANEAKGQALAEVLFRCVREQASSLKRFLHNIADLDQAGRRGFRVAVQQHLKDIRAHVHDKEGTDEHAAYAATARSAGVRMSEAVTFSKAIDAGYNASIADNPYHSLVSGARLFLQGQASGPTVKRGRPAKSLADKIKAYLERECKTAEDFEQAAEVAAAVAASKE